MRLWPRFGKSQKRLEWRSGRFFDLPKDIDLEVTEFQAEIGECACGRQHTAEFPAGVEAPVQYGQRIRATVAYYSAYQLLPQKRITEAMADLYGVPMSVATVNTILVNAHERLAATEEAIKAAITRQSGGPCRRDRNVRQRQEVVGAYLGHGFVHLLFLS